MRTLVSTKTGAVMNFLARPALSSRVSGRAAPQLFQLVDDLIGASLGSQLLQIFANQLVHGGATPRRQFTCAREHIVVNRQRDVPGQSLRVHVIRVNE